MAKLFGNRYEIGQMIGTGGMADVYIGEDQRLSRKVAVKVLRSDLARDPSFVARFRKEDPTFHVFTDEESGETRIGDLARHIRSGEAEKAISLATSNPAGVTFVASKKDGEVSPAIVEATVAALKKATDLAKTIEKENHLAAYQIIAHNKVLCGPRNGPVGVNEWNTHIRDKVHGIADGDLFRPGIPLLVTVNSPRSRLVNGDIGLVVNVQEPDGTIEINIFFPSPILFLMNSTVIFLFVSTLFINLIIFLIFRAIYD